MSPDDNQAASATGFDPVVYEEGIGGQALFRWLPTGISKPCHIFSRQLPMELFSATRWQSLKRKHALDTDLQLNCCLKLPNNNELSKHNTLLSSEYTALNDIQ